MSPELIQFIVEHEHDDPAQIVLSKKEILGHSSSFVANQIDCRKRAKEKLPTWFSIPAIAYPPKTNLEQCSSEVAARFKNKFILETNGEQATIVDLTGGFGVDSYYFSKIFKKVIHVEPDTGLCQLAKESHQLLGATNIHYRSQLAEKFLEGFDEQADWIFIDPSRKADGKKMVKLSDCEPDVVQLLKTLWSKTSHILIKAAPLLDIKEGLKQLPNTAHVIVVSINNDCKEVLFHLQKDFIGEPQIICVNIHGKTEERFSFNFSDESEVDSTFSAPELFLYEPNTSILKAGAFKKIGKAFGLAKLAPSTHLYTSQHQLLDFPGRVFKIIGDISAQVKLLPENKGNIISRNHPLSPDQIKKKYKLKDGGERYVIAFSGEKKKYILVAERTK